MKRDLPSLNAVRMFEAAARLQSFTKAATELNVTQGAVSRQIALLEDQLGCKLFERKGPQLKLTSVGMQYQAVVQDALETLRKGTLKILNSGGKRHLTISILPSFATYWLMPRMASLEAAIPAISMRLAVTYRNIDFNESRDIDFAIRVGKGNWPDLYLKKFTRHRLFPACSPQLAEKIHSVEDLLDQKLIAEVRPYDEWHLWFKQSKVKFEPREERMYDDTGVQIQAAVAGQGVILARDSYVRNLLTSGQLVRLFDSSIESEYQYYFVCPPNRLADEHIKAFHDWIVAAGEEEAGLNN